MIVPMMKYSFILYHRDHEAFLNRLQGLGLVDITVAGWEPNEAERRLMADLDRQRAAVKTLAAVRRQPGWTDGKGYRSPEKTLAHTAAASADIDRLHGEQAEIDRQIDELRPWGDFSPEEIGQLGEAGIRLRFFTSPAKDFYRQLPAWEEQYAVETVAETGATVWFVVATEGDQIVSIDANEVKLPARNREELEARREEIVRELAARQAVLERAAAGLKALEGYGNRMEEELHRRQVGSAAPREAENALVLLEGWAPAGSQEAVDAFLAADGSAYALKSEPEAEDEPPVLLRNNRFARLFEPIAALYSLPKYGTMDLTPWFAPFFMLFFGFCLADAGYGALYLIACVIAWFVGPKKFRGVVALVALCAVSTIFFGLLTGNAFGIPLADHPLFAGIAPYMLDPDKLFVVAIAVGIVQILYAMMLRIVFTMRYRGFRQAASSLGWFIALCSLLAAIGLPLLGVGIEGYTMNSIPFWAVTGIGLFLMLFMNSPGKNPLINFGAGLWNTYNDVTGFISDALSYIRLFALGLSGGIQALVFNQLALTAGAGIDLPVVKQLIILVVLLIGQGITLFTASLGAFVHPLRLTFVEFYKNAGFTDGGRAFRPLRRG